MVLRLRSWGLLFFLGGLFSLSSLAQVKVSFSQQGAEVLKGQAGRRLKGVGLASVQVCNLAPAAGVLRHLDSGLVYQAANDLAISTISPAIAAPLFDRSVSTSVARLWLDLVNASSAVIGVLGLTNKIRMPTWAAELLTAIPVAFQFFNSFFTYQLPSDQVTKDQLLQGAYDLAPQSCIPGGRLIVYRFQGNWAPRETVIP